MLKEGDRVRTTKKAPMGQRSLTGTIIGRERNLTPTKKWVVQFDSAIVFGRNVGWFTTRQLEVIG